MNAKKRRREEWGLLAHLYNFSCIYIYNNTIRIFFGFSPSLDFREQSLCLIWAKLGSLVQQEIVLLEGLTYPK